MKNNKNNTKSFGTILGKIVKNTSVFLSLLFCALRACGIIHWEWYYVMMPIFVKWAMILVSLAITGIASIAVLADDNDTKSK